MRCVSPVRLRRPDPDGALEGDRTAVHGRAVAERPPFIQGPNRPSFRFRRISSCSSLAYRPRYGTWWSGPPRATNRGLQRRARSTRSCTITSRPFAAGARVFDARHMGTMAPLIYSVAVLPPKGGEEARPVMPARHAAHSSADVASTPGIARTNALDNATPTSIAAAREAQRRERTEFMEWAGIRLDRDGRPILSHRRVRRAREQD